MSRVTKPTTPDAATSRRIGLLRHAAERLLSGDGAGRLEGPLCVVIPGGRAVILDDLAGRAAAAGWQVVSCDGVMLGRELAAAVAGDSWDRLQQRFSAARLVVVQRLEAVGPPDRQAALRQLVDAAPGPAWCVAVGRHPLAGHLTADLAARIAAGLTITLPAAGERHDHDEPASQPCITTPCRPPTVSRIVAVTARHFGLAPADVIGPGRGRSVARARGLAMYLARQFTPGSYASIGRALGGRDHTTAMHGVRVAAARLAGDRCFADDAAAITARLGGARRTRRPASRMSVS